MIRNLSFLPADQLYGYLEVDSSRVYTLGVSPKTYKERVYKTIDRSPTTNVMVYTHFEGLPKLKVNPFTLVIYWIDKTITKQIKNKSDNMSV